MKKRLLFILLPVFIIVGGIILLKYIPPDILENKSDPFKNRVLSSEETKIILKSVNLDIDFKKSKELYNDIGFPPDGYRYFAIESNKNISEYFMKIYKDKEENIGNSRVYRKVDRDEAIKLIKENCSKEELLKLMEKDFDKKGTLFGVMEINSLGDNRKFYDETYIISCRDSNLYIFYHKI